MKDTWHYYQIEIRSKVNDPAVQTWEIAKYDGRTQVLTGGTFTSPLDQFVTIRVVVSGSTIAAYSGQNNTSTLLGIASDSTFATGGIGLRTWGTNGSIFDNVTVTAATSASPTPTPTPSSQPTNPSSVATFEGCPVFTAGDYYNADVSNAPSDAHSADYLASVESVDNTGFYASLGNESINIANNSTPLLTVHPAVSYHSWPVPYPWASGYSIEPAGDEHYVAVNAQSCHLYEGYGMKYSNGSLSGYSGKNYDMRKPFAIGIGVMASGLSMFGGAVRHEEIATGIHHALNFSLWSNSLCNCFVAPAAESDGVPYKGSASNYEMPYGAHLRLNAGYDCSSWGAQSGAICTALKHYGMYAADTGGHYSNNNALYFMAPNDGGSWNGGDLGALGNLRLSDFVVLSVGHI